MSKIIILGRPHPMIVESMKEFMERNGYEPFAISKIQDLKNIPHTGKVHGAVISTAVKSVVKESYIEVFQEIRKLYPDLPVLFATIGNAESMAKILSLTLSKIIKDSVLYIADHNTQLNNLNLKKTFLIINRENINAPEYKEISDNILKTFFS